MSRKSIEEIRDLEKTFTLIAQDRVGDLQRRTYGLEDDTTKIDKNRVRKLLDVTRVESERKKGILLATGALQAIQGSSTKEVGW